MVEGKTQRKEDEVMALTRKFLSALGIDADKVDEIISAHSDTVTALKEERDKYKKDAEDLTAVRKELEDLKKNGGDFQEKYNEEHKAFEAYKKTVEKEKTEAGIRSAYSALLTKNGVDSKRIDSILRVTDFSKMQVVDGKLKDEDKLEESIKSEWSGFIVKESTKGAGVENPPSGKSSTMTKDEIMKIKDTGERQKAIADNHELFGF